MPGRLRTPRTPLKMPKHLGTLFATLQRLGTPLTLGCLRTPLAMLEHLDTPLKTLKHLRIPLTTLHFVRAPSPTHFSTLLTTLKHLRTPLTTPKHLRTSLTMLKPLRAPFARLCQCRSARGTNLGLRTKLQRAQGVRDGLEPIRQICAGGTTQDLQTEVREAQGSSDRLEFVLGIEGPGVALSPRVISHLRTTERARRRSIG